MDQGEFVILMYHEIQAAKAPARQVSPGVLRYVVREEEFRRHLDMVAEAGLHATALASALAGERSGSQVVFTFDDGAASDLDLAAECLSTHAIPATFFIVPGYLGRPGYLSTAGVRALSERGFEIGSHSLRHDFLTELAPPALRDDLRQSKAELERISGRSVVSLSCPGGRWNRRVADTAREAGYTAVLTSRLCRNHAGTDRFRLGRIVVRRETGEAEFVRRARGEGLGAELLRGAMLAGLRQVLGNSRYDRLQRRLAR